MLQRCNLEIEEKEVAPEEILPLLQAEFQNLNEVVILFESNKYAQLDYLSNLHLGSQDFSICQRLLASSAHVEIRFESSRTQQKFFCRILKETSGNEYLVREEKLPLRSNKNIAEQIYLAGMGRIISKEYYSADTDGMFVFVAERLAGFTVER